jgi:hypothetical protein
MKVNCDSGLKNGWVNVAMFKNISSLCYEESYFVSFLCISFTFDCICCKADCDTSNHYRGKILGDKQNIKTTNKQTHKVEIL